MMRSVDAVSAPARQQDTKESSGLRSASNFLQYLSAGLLTSTAYATVTYPFHRVKVVLQTQDTHHLIRNGTIPRYTFLNSFVRLTREQGILSLWRGNLPYLLRHGTSITTSFAFKDAFKDMLPRYSSKHELGYFTAMNLLAGGLAGAASLALVYPFEFATIRLAAELGPEAQHAGAQQHPHQQLSKHARVTRAGTQQLLHMVRTEGLLACYRGLGVSMVGMMAYKALFFGLYDTGKAVLLDSSGKGQGQGHVHTLHSWALATGTVVVASSATYPLDVIRKRMVMEVASGKGGYSGFGAMVRHMARTEGLAGFYRFYGVDMLFRSGAGILLVLYDKMQQWQARREESRGAQN